MEGISNSEECISYITNKNSKCLKLPPCFSTKDYFNVANCTKPQKLPSHLYVLSPYSLVVFYNSKKAPLKYSADTSPVLNLIVSVTLKIYTMPGLLFSRGFLSVLLGKKMALKVLK